MLKFNCYSCGESFKVSFENLYNKISIQCPNCDNQLSNDTVKSLRKFSESYMDVIDSLYEKNTFESSFGLSVIEMPESIPERPSKYNFTGAKDPDSYWKHRQKPPEPYKPRNIELPEKFNDPDLPF